MASFASSRVQRNEEVTLLGEKVNNFVGLLGCQVHLKAATWTCCQEIANSTFMCSTRAKNTFFLLKKVYSCFANPTFPRRKFPSPSCRRAGKISSAKLPDVGLLEQTADLFSSLAFRSEVWRLPGTFLGHCPPSTRHVRPGCWMGDRLTTYHHGYHKVAPLTCCALVSSDSISMLVRKSSLGPFLLTRLWNQALQKDVAETAISGTPTSKYDICPGAKPDVGTRLDNGIASVWLRWDLRQRHLWRSRESKR